MASGNYGYICHINGVRTLPNSYSYIPLTIMMEKMKEKELPIKSVRLKKDYPIPEDLKKVKDRIFDYVFGDGPPLTFRPVEELNQKLARREMTRQSHRRQLQDSLMLMKLRNEYLHFSARFEDVFNKARSGCKCEINDG